VDQHPRGQVSDWHNAAPYSARPIAGPLNHVALSTADNDPSTACQIASTDTDTVSRSQTTLSTADNTISIPAEITSTTADITPMDVKIPDRLNSDSQYVVLGNLILPRPPEARRALAEKWELELCKLNTRNMEGVWPILTLLALLIASRSLSFANNGSSFLF
jgi:hypothetical protein